MTRRRIHYPPRPKPDTGRAPWQIEQAQRCGCKGTDDLCPCQNENPWPRPKRDLEGEIRTLELQQQTDRQTIASLLTRAQTVETERDEARAVLAEAVASLETLERWVEKLPIPTTGATLRLIEIAELLQRLREASVSKAALLARLNQGGE